MKPFQKLALASSLTLGACATPQFGVMKHKPEIHVVPAQPLVVTKEVEKPITSEDVREVLSQTRRELLAVLGTDKEGYDPTDRSLTACTYIAPENLKDFDPRAVFSYMAQTLSTRLMTDGIVNAGDTGNYSFRSVFSEIGLTCSRVELLGVEGGKPKKKPARTGKDFDLARSGLGDSLHGELEASLGFIDR